MIINKLQTASCFLLPTLYPGKAPKGRKRAQRGNVKKYAWGHDVFNVLPIYNFFYVCRGIKHEFKDNCPGKGGRKNGNSKN